MKPLVVRADCSNINSLDRRLLEIDLLTPMWNAWNSENVEPIGSLAHVNYFDLKKSARGGPADGLY
jgi:hypothetical protein